MIVAILLNTTLSSIISVRWGYLQMPTCSLMRGEPRARRRGVLVSYNSPGRRSPASRYDTPREADTFDFEPPPRPLLVYVREGREKGLSISPTLTLTQRETQFNTRHRPLIGDRVLTTSHSSSHPSCRSQSGNCHVCTHALLPQSPSQAGRQGFWQGVAARHWTWLACSAIKLRLIRD